MKHLHASPPWHRGLETTSTPSEFPAPSWRPARRAAARLALVLVGLGALGARSRAQDLLIVHGNRTIMRVAPSGSSSTESIAGIPAWESIVGVKRNLVAPGTYQMRLVTEDQFTLGTTVYTLELPDLGPMATNGCLVQGGNWFPNARPLVGYGSNSGLLVLPNPFTAVLDSAGYLYGSPDCTGSPGSGLLMDLAPDGGVISGTAIHGDDLYVLVRSATQLVLNRIRYPSVPLTPPFVHQTWTVSNAVGALQVMGMTLDCSGRLWAYVNRPVSCLGHGQGDFVLARTDETIEAATLTLRAHQDLGDWQNPGLGCPTFPPAFLFFDKAAPEGLALTGPTSGDCEPMLLTASWDGGPATGTVEPGSLQVTKGVPFSVGPAVGAQTYSLTVQGLSCVSGTSTHAVTWNCEPATTVDYCDAPPIENLDGLTATPPKIGTTWTATFTRTGGGSGRFQIRVWTTRLGGNGVPPTFGSVPWPMGTAGRRMTGGVYIGSLPPGQPGSGSPVVPTLPFTSGTGIATSPMPTSLSFVGFHFVCQARSGTGVAGSLAPRLSSDFEGTIGMF